MIDLVDLYEKSDMNSKVINLYSKIPIKMRDNNSHIYALNACSKIGFIDQAKKIYQEIDVKTENIVTAMV